MLANVFTFTLRDRLRATVLFALGLLGVVAMYVSVFPGIQEQMVGYSEALPEAMRAFLGSDMASPAGYLQSTIFTVLGPVLLVAAAVTAGAGALAGEEEQGTLRLLLSVPRSRRDVALQKLAGVAVALTLLAAALFAWLVVFVRLHGLDVPTGHLLAGTVHLHALALFAASLAFAVGAASGRRAAAVGAATAVVVLSFVADGVADLVERLGFLQQVSPFSWYAATEPVMTGFAWGRLALLYGVAAVVAGAGIWRFTRRDLA